jgi:hypothetical protein
MYRYALILAVFAGSGTVFAQAGPQRVSLSLPRESSSCALLAVLSQARIAQGGDAWDDLRTLRTQGVLRTTAMQGRFESLDDARSGRHRDRYDLGELRGENGFDGKRVWTRDPLGATRIETASAPRAAAINEAWRRSHSYWTAYRRGAMRCMGRRDEAGGTFYVIRVQPRGGSEFEMWVDRSTGLFDRIVERIGAETLTTWFSDYRDVQGLRLPFALRVANGAPQYDQLYIIERIDVDVPVDAASFAIPAKPRR